MVDFHITAKPIGSFCNLACEYCYYLHKQKLLKQDLSTKITNEVLTKYIQENIHSQDSDTINFTWHGGEPTLLGLDFFKNVIKLQEKFCPSNKQIVNVLQTNGILIDANWSNFFYDNNFLIGLSIDGPQNLHDFYRYDKNKKSLFDKVMNCVKLFHKYGVSFNTLSVVNNFNAKYPLDVYRFLKNEVGSQYIQFLPCVEYENFTSQAPNFWKKDQSINVTSYSVRANDYGNFLCKIFDNWYQNDIGKVFVMTFEATLNCWAKRPSPICFFQKTCGKALAIENNGDIFSCDHFVYSEYKLGNILTDDIKNMVLSKQQTLFGQQKYDNLISYCKNCKYLFACYGECPKNRFLIAPSKEFGLNYLCSGLKKYFQHTEPYMKILLKKLSVEV